MKSYIFMGAMCVASVALAETEPSARDMMNTQAEALVEFVETDVARAFLDATTKLSAIEPRVVYRHPETRDALTEIEAEAVTPEDLDAYKRMELDEQYYYFTRYGSPLAFVRALDLLGAAGLSDLDGVRLADFGFGSIGHLRLLAECGADAQGIEVDDHLRALYSHDTDAGKVGPGHVALHFGSFPGEIAVGDGYDVFVSKNTLKRGYIHPAEEVDPRFLVHLGVDDEAYVSAVHDLLKPGGFFLIYNLSPPQSEERYIPWADGRSPFTTELFDAAGFDVLAFDVDDTETAREMGGLLGWGDTMNLETDLFGTYTLVQKR